MIDLIGQDLASRYHVSALLGAGATARVFLARDRQLDRDVAVKILHESLAADATVRKRFATEARSAARLSHPNLLAVHDVGEHQGVPFLVTEYLAGGSLSAILRSGYRLSVGQALVIALDVARGLEYAHAAGVVHRDIKPANLLFDLEGRLRIGDFGIAKVLSEATLTAPDTMSPATAAYASPEQARGGTAGPPSDVYSLALVIVECVTGQPVFQAETPVATLAARLDGPLRVPDELGPVRLLLERAGQVDPALRPEAGEMIVSLLATAETLSRPDPLPLAGPALVDVGAPRSENDPTLISPDHPPETLDPTVPTQSPPTRTPRGSGSFAATAVISERLDRESDGDDSGGPPHRWMAGIAAFVLVGIVAAGATMAWWNAQPVLTPVPDLVGQDQEKVDTLLPEEVDWDVEIRQVRLLDTVAGQIVEQDPAAGTEVEEQSPLVLTVSLGAPLVDIPDDLAGRPLDQAEALLIERGLLLGEVATEFDEEVEVDVVLGVDESSAGVEDVPMGGAVDLVVSAGPAPRVIPELVGLDAEQVVDDLESLGLEVETEDDASREVDEGVVISADVEEGEEIERGSTVMLVVSSGLPWINIPDVTGLSPALAADVLEERNLIVAGTEGPPNQEVVATRPAVGAPIQEGREVTLITEAASTEE